MVSVMLNLTDWQQQNKTELKWTEEFSSVLSFCIRLNNNNNNNTDNF